MESEASSWVNTNFSTTLLEFLFHLTHDACRFESSETLAAFVASTPLLEESWKVCGVADASVESNFAVIRVGGTAYVGFSGVKLGAGVDQSCRNLVPLPDELFCTLCVDGADPAMVHTGLLNLFLSVYTDNLFRDQVSLLISISITLLYWDFIF